MDLNETAKDNNCMANAFDTSQYPYPGAIKSTPVWELTLKTWFYGIIIVTSLMGNIFVIVTILRYRRLRTSTNIYILNLGICDLLVTLTCMWVHLVDDLTEGWVLGAFFCTTNSFFQVLSLVASTLTLTLIACDRFFGIVFAMKARLTDKRCKVFITSLWIFALLASSPLLVYRKQFTREWANHVEIWCDDSWPLSTSNTLDNRTLVSYTFRKIYYTSVSLILYFIPCGIMTLAYSFIIRTLWYSKLPGESITSMEQAQRRKKKKAILMLIAILLAFMTCWLPFVVSLVYAEHRSNLLSKLPEWYPIFQYIAVFLADSNSALNPLIYTGFNNGFRKGFRETFRRYKYRKAGQVVENNRDGPFYQMMELKCTTRTITKTSPCLSRTSPFIGRAMKVTQQDFLTCDL